MLIKPELCQLWMTQVLANPTADIQEGPKIGRAELKARGVRPYDEKVQPALLACLHLAITKHLLRPQAASSAGCASAALMAAFTAATLHTNRQSS